MSFLRNSSLREAFENIKIKSSKMIGTPVCKSIISGLERKVGLVREHDNIMLTKSTKVKLNAELGLGLK